MAQRFEPSLESNLFGEFQIEEQQLKIKSFFKIPTHLHLHYFSDKIFTIEAYL